MWPAIASPLRSRTTPATRVTSRGDREDDGRPPVLVPRRAASCLGLLPGVAARSPWPSGAAPSSCHGSDCPARCRRNRPGDPEHGDKERSRRDPERDQASRQLGARDDDGQDARPRACLERPARATPLDRSAADRLRTPNASSTTRTTVWMAIPPRMLPTATPTLPDSRRADDDRDLGQVRGQASMIKPPRAEPRWSLVARTSVWFGQLDAGDPDRGRRRSEDQQQRYQGQAGHTALRSFSVPGGRTGYPFAATLTAIVLPRPEQRATQVSESPLDDGARPGVVAALQSRSYVRGEVAGDHGVRAVDRLERGRDRLADRHPRPLRPAAGRARAAAEPGGRGHLCQQRLALGAQRRAACRRRPTRRPRRARRRSRRAGGGTPRAPGRRRPRRARLAPPVSAPPASRSAGTSFPGRESSVCRCSRPRRAGIADSSDPACRRTTRRPVRAAGSSWSTAATRWWSARRLEPLRATRSRRCRRYVASAFSRSARARSPSPRRSQARAACRR